LVLVDAGAPGVERSRLATVGGDPVYEVVFTGARTPDGVVRDAASTLGRALLHATVRSEEHTSELQSLTNLVCRLLLEKKTMVFLTGRRGQTWKTGFSTRTARGLLGEATGGHRNDLTPGAMVQRCAARQARGFVSDYPH